MTCYFGHMILTTFRTKLWIANRIDAKNDRNAPRYTKAALVFWPISNKFLASKTSQSAAPKKATEEINSPVDL